MSKPCDLGELLSRVKNLLQLAQGAPTPTKPPRGPTVEQIEFGDVRANFTTHEVTVNDQPVKMTPKELRLLRYFVENPQRVISRAELLTQVWELPAGLQTRAVDQFIARLRKMIERSPGEPVHLLTLRDAGYRFLIKPAPAASTPETTEDDGD